MSNLTRAASGHLYFTLKDERAQVRCTMWRSRAQLLAFQLTEGMHVEVRGQASIYEPRGDLQFSVDSVRRAGQGSLFEAFLRLKARLEAEGLFQPERKRPLPTRPRGIGVVTSLAAAALHDVLAALARRAPHVPVVIYPTPVQGDQAGPQIAAAIHTAGERAEQDGIDLLIVCRGGGSIEDLWAFNHEAVARALVAVPIPVVSGVGHETDTTLADFAVDWRAATPTAAAELASAGWYALRQRLPVLAQQLQRAGLYRVQRASQRVDDLQRRLIHPRTRLQRSAERLAGLQQRLRQAWQTRMRRQQARLVTLDALLAAHAPRLAPLRANLVATEQRLDRALAWRMRTAQQKLDSLSARLAALNPDAVLARGYAIVRQEDGRILRDAVQLSGGETLDIQLAQSHVTAKVPEPGKS